MSLFGNILRVMTFGESHGSGVGCILEGIPPGLQVEESDIQEQLDRRRPGTSALTTSRQELDRVEILSGIANGFTIGTPIAMMVRNQDHRTFDYAETEKCPRPGHADYTYHVKYNGFTATSGGGRASARETIGRVAAGAVAAKWLKDNYGTSIVSWVSTVGPVDIPLAFATELEVKPPSRSEVDALGTVRDPSKFDGEVETRCPDPASAKRMAEYIAETKAAGDSTGGIATCVVQNVPVGLGEPCFDKTEAELAKAMLSLPATKGFEIGSGFAGVRLRGSEHNDRFDSLSKSICGRVLLKTSTNSSGGTLGGITSGNNIVFRVAFKPVSSIGQPQKTISYQGELSCLEIKGRHDPCVLPRTPPLIESMTALVIADLALRQRARVGSRELPVLCPTPAEEIKEKDD